MDYSKRWYRKKGAVLGTLIVIFVLSGIGGYIYANRIKQDTPTDVAKTFVKAVLKGDTKTIETINRSDVGFPASYLLTLYAKDFADGADGKEYQYDQNDKVVYVVDGKSSKITSTIPIIQIDKKYYINQEVIREQKKKSQEVLDPVVKSDEQRLEIVDYSNDTPENALLSLFKATSEKKPDKLIELLGKNEKVSLEQAKQIIEINQRFDQKYVKIEKAASVQKGGKMLWGVKATMRNLERQSDDTSIYYFERIDGKYYLVDQGL